MDIGEPIREVEFEDPMEPAQVPVEEPVVVPVPQEEPAGV